MGKFKTNIANEDDLFHTNRFIQAELRSAGLEVGDTLEVEITCKIIKAPYVSRWTHHPRGTIFRRRWCPICGNGIPNDRSNDGYPEMEEVCPTDRKHYRFAMNFFGEYLTVAGKEFSPKDTALIDQLLDEVGNKEFI